MDLLKKLFTLGLLLCAVSSDQFLRVVQAPERLRQKPGDSVTMNCEFNSSSEDLRIEWTKHQAENVMVLSARNNTSTASQSYQNRTQHHFNSTLSSLTISAVNPNDSGLYICEVLIEIPLLHRVFGNGTHLQVDAVSQQNSTSSYTSKTEYSNNTTADPSNNESTGPSERTPQDETTKWILIVCGSIAAMLVLVTACFLGKKFMAYKNRDPVYANIQFKSAPKNYRPTDKRKCDL